MKKLFLILTSRSNGDNVVRVTFKHEFCISCNSSVKLSYR